MHELFVMQEGTPPIEVQALKEYQLWHLSKANPSEYGRFLIEFKTADLDKWARIVSQDPCNQKLGVVLFQHGTNKTSFMRVVQQQQLQLRKKEFFLIQFRIKVNGKSLKLEGARPQFMFSWDLLGALDPKMEITTIEVLGPRDFRNGMLAIMYMRNEWTDNPPLPDRILQTDQTHEELKVLVAKHRAEDQPQIQAPQKQIPSDQKTAASLNGNGPKHDGPATAPSQHAASATQPSPHPPLQPSYHHTRTTTSTPAPAKDPVSNDDDEDDGFIKFDAE
ncbi:hypothetical protein HK104_010350 [Borealophlyctis nickersoniae]|nr:hypothetical protein HK104_010350 [Borealophlyctis nickersoniae]